MNEAQWLASDDPQAMLRHLTHEWMGEVAWHNEGTSRRPPTDRDPAGQLVEAERRAPLLSARKLRLFACACVRLFKPQNSAEQVDELELKGETYGMTDTQWAEAWAFDAPDSPTKAALLREVVGNPFRPVKLPVVTTAAPTGPFRVPYPSTVEVAPARLTTYTPWLTPTVLTLAQAAYNERLGRKCPRRHSVFDGTAAPTCPDCGGTGTIDDGALDPLTLAALADALEEAGCTDEVLLSHLRPTPCVWCGTSGVAPWHTTSTGTSTDPIPCSLCGGTGRFGRQPTHVRGCWALDLILGKE